jgi:hypothetical protein
MLQMACQSRHSTEDLGFRSSPIFFALWKSFHAAATKEPRKPLDAKHHLHAWCTQEVRKPYVRTNRVRRRQFAWESRAVRCRDRRRSSRRRTDANCQVDRVARQQRGRVCRAIGSSAICLVEEGAIASRLLRFRCGGATNVRRICLPEPQTLFVALDLPQASSQL